MGRWREGLGFGVQGSVEAGSGRDQSRLCYLPVTCRTTLPMGPLASFAKACGSWEKGKTSSTSGFSPVCPSRSTIHSQPARPSALVYVPTATPPMRSRRKSNDEVLN